MRAAPTVHLLDLPDEILLLILKNLNDLDMLYSFFDIGNHRLHRLTRAKTLPTRLHFKQTLLSHPHIDIVFERLTRHIFPHIHRHVQSLTLPTQLIDRVILRGHFPNLVELTVCNFQRDTSLHHFSDASPLADVCKKRIRKLNLFNEEFGRDIGSLEKYTEQVYAHLFTYFDNLEEFHIPDRLFRRYPPLRIRNLSRETFASTKLTSLTVKVETIGDCWCLLDGRLKQLRSLDVQVFCMGSRVTSQASDDLPDLTCFSFYSDSCEEYPTDLRFLVRRMTALQQLSVRLSISQSTVVDPLDLIDDLTSGLLKLHTVNFHIDVNCDPADLNRYLCGRDEERDAKMKKYGQVCDVVNHSSISAVHHCFTLPFQYAHIMQLSCQFPETRFQHVVFLWVANDGPFEYEFFVRVARCFPVLRYLNVDEGWCSIHYVDFHRTDRYDRLIEFPHLEWLQLFAASGHGIEQFLNENITRLPRLTELRMMYEDLEVITHDFTRHETRRNCAHVTDLITDIDSMVGSRDYHDHFPSLYVRSADEVRRLEG